MQSYIIHFLEDIANAHRQEILQGETVEESTETMDEHFAAIERWIEREPVHTFSYYCGLQAEQFPPADRLSEMQMKQIIKAFGQLLFSWNLDVSIPDSIPTAKFYSLLITVLNKKTDIVNSRFMIFEFCNYDSPTCPFEEYCTCKNFEDDSNNNMNRNLPDGELPF